MPPTTKKPPTPPLMIGSRVRHARLTKGLRLQELADLAGYSKSMLSKVEGDKVVPSLTTLQRITEALEIGLATLFASAATDGDLVMRTGKRPVLDVDPLRSGKGVQYERIIPVSRAVLLEANIHIIQPGGEREDTIHHQGEELGFVLEGQLELTVAKQTHVARAHDSFFFSSTLGHTYRNPGPGVTRVVWVNTPPVR